MNSILDSCRGFPTRSFSKGELLFEESVEAGLIYVLREGSVEIFKGGMRLNSISDPGAVFGEMSFLLGTPPIATVKATKLSTFYRIEEPALFFEEHPETVMELAKTLAGRLNLITVHLVEMQMSDSDENGKAAGGAPADIKRKIFAMAVESL